MPLQSQHGTDIPSDLGSGGSQAVSVGSALPLGSPRVQGEFVGAATAPLLLWVAKAVSLGAHRHLFCCLLSASHLMQSG